MLVRIVRMPLQEGRRDAFLEAFNEARGRIRSYDGCHRLDLLCDRLHRDVVFTYSLWTSEAHLERYLHSDLFRSTWSRVRPLFDGKPQAWSLENLQSVDPVP